MHAWHPSHAPIVCLAPASQASLLLAEANLSPAALEAACATAAAARVPVFLEPVSVPKAVRWVNWCLEVSQMVGVVV